MIRVGIHYRALTVTAIVAVVALVCGCRADKITSGELTQNSAFTVTANECEANAPSSNITDGAVSDFSPSIDYFPDKAAFRYARQLSVEYHGHYKLVTFRSNTNGETVRYVLVQRGTPTPDLPVLRDPSTRLVQVPVERFALGTYRYGGAVGVLDVAERLVVIPATNIITTPAIRRHIEAGKLTDSYSTELIMEREAGATFDYYSNAGQSLDQTKRQEVGLQSVLMAEHAEANPLAKTEWIKFFAMFFNRERAAEEYFNRVASEYESLAARVRESLTANKHRPRVLVNNKSGDTWSVYGGENAFARLIEDAGGAYLWGDLDSRVGSFPIAYEAGYNRASDADVWILGPDASVRQPRFDERLQGLAVFRSGRVFVSFNPDADGRNPYWDQALINPHLELADYVKAIHPELLPEHRFVFLRQLGQRAE